MTEKQLPEDELPIPPDIEAWFVEQSKPYEDQHPSPGYGRSIFESGAYCMYQKMQPQIASLTTLLSIEKKNVSTALGNYEILKGELDGVKNKLDECQQSRMSLLDMIANYKP